ncbi:BON domain-containing protein [Polynucleobacter paneuropaeus]|jgi:hyperosmotically inducible periplasmic protein|nr:BON domain-containing protein [Polynucleobacter paneuropaeus]
MKMDNSFKTVFAAMMIVSGLAACDKPGPAESAGKKIDQASESVSTSVSNTADKAGDAMSQQTKNAGQMIKDTDITASIKLALMNEPDMQSTKINVVTTKGIVTLTGIVSSAANKDKAIKLAESVDGVKSVQSKLKISK